MSEQTKSTPKPPLMSYLFSISRALQHYMVLWFVLLLLVVYSFVLLRIQAAASAQPNQADIDSQVQTTATPHVDPKIVDQILNLQDHSVNVKALFDEARSNPFQE